MSDQEFGLLQCLTGNLPLGKDQEFRKRILDLQPLLASDNTNPFLQQGKQLAWLTRHCDSEGERKGRDRLSGPDGYISWHDLEVTPRDKDGRSSDRKILPWALVCMDPLDLACVILFNNKGRFECEVRVRYGRADKGNIPSLYIRATQGHSYDIDRNLLFFTKIDTAQAVDLNPVLHGTKARHWDSIRRSGLIPGGFRTGKPRQAVHFMAMGWHNIKPQGPHSRLRDGSDFLIQLNLEKWIQEGHEAYLAPNGVVSIFETIPMEYFFYGYAATPTMPKSPTEWNCWWVTADINPHKTDPWAEPAPAEETTRPPDEDLDAVLDIRNQSLDTGVYDIFGDQVPNFFLWKHLPQEFKDHMSSRFGILNEEFWFEEHGSGYGAMVLYVILRETKRKLIAPADLGDHASSGPERWESALLFKAFGGNTARIKVFLQGTLEFVREDFDRNFPFSSMLTHNHRIDLGTLLNYIEAKAPRMSGNRLEGRDWIPTCLQWEANYFQNRKFIMICDPSRDFLEFSHKTVEDESARAEYLAFIAANQPNVPVTDDTQEEYQAMTAALEQRALESIRHNQKIPAIMDLDTVQQSETEEDDIGADFGDDESASVEHEVSQPASPRSLPASPEPKAKKVELVPRVRVRRNLQKWAQSIVNQERARAREAAEPAFADDDTQQQPAEVRINEQAIPPHPRQSFDISGSLDFIKEALNNPREPPEYPGEIDRFEHGDDRVFATPEVLEKNLARNREYLTRYDDRFPETIAEADELYEEMREDLLPGCEMDYQAQIQQWSGQLVYASMNMGDVRRRPCIPSRDKRWKTSEDKSMLVEFLRRSPAHIICLAEADGINSQDMRHRLSGWKFLSSHDSNLAVGVRGNDASLQVLYDSTDPNAPGGRDYPDDPTAPLEPEATLWYLIVEVDMGTIDASDHPDYQKGKGAKGKGQARVRASGRVHRASFDKVRVLTFVINNKKAAASLHNVRLRLRQMLLDVARYQVDFLGGDANAAMYKYFGHQPVPNVRQSAFIVMLNTLIAAVNSVLTAPEHKVHADFVSSNAQEKLMRIQTLFEQETSTKAWEIIQKEDLSPDCVVGVILSWGHSQPVMKWRDEQGAKQYSALAVKALGYTEFFVKTAEFPLMLTNKHLWLSTEGNGDCSWHCPLFIRLRLLPDKNKRKRTASKVEQRNQRWQERSWQSRSTPSTAPREPQSSSSSSWTPSVPWTREQTSAGTASSSSSSRPTAWHSSWDAHWHW